MKKLKELYKRSPAIFSVLLCIAMVLTTVLVHTVLGMLPLGVRSIDTTSKKIFTLSETTKSILSEIDEPVEITLVTNTGIPNSTTVEKLIARYAAQNKRIKVKTAYADELYAQYGTLTAGSAIIKGAKRETVVNSADYYDFTDEYFTLSYACYYDAVNQGYNLGSYGDFVNSGYAEALGLFDVARYEKTLTTAIDYVTADDVTVIYTITDHGTMALAKYLLPELRDNYIMVVSGKLSDGIPADADGVLIENPTEDITAAELTSLSEFLARGGKLTLSTSYGNTEKLPLLMQLCDEYGLSTDGNMIMEDDKSYNGGYEYILAPIVVKEALAGGTEVKDGSVMFPIGTGITAKEKEGITQSVFLKTSDNAYAKKDLKNATSLAFDPNTDIRGCYALGVTATHQNGGAITWTSSFSLSDSSYDPLSKMTNSSVFIAAITSTHKTQPQLDIASASMLSEPFVAPASAYGAGIALAIIIPCGLVTVGVLIMLRRRNKASKSYSEPLD